MRLMLAALLLGTLSGAAFAGDTVEACQARHADLSKRVADYKGESMMKRIIQADLDRANRELIEGDADECMEALDHATKLLNGEV